MSGLFDPNVAHTSSVSSRGVECAEFCCNRFFFQAHEKPITHWTSPQPPVISAPVSPSRGPRVPPVALHVQRGAHPPAEVCGRSVADLAAAGCKTWAAFHRQATLGAEPFVSRLSSGDCGHEEGDRSTDCGPLVGRQRGRGGQILCLPKNCVWFLHRLIPAHLTRSLLPQPLVTRPGVGVWPQVGAPAAGRPDAPQRPREGGLAPRPPPRRPHRQQRRPGHNGPHTVSRRGMIPSPALFVVVHLIVFYNKAFGYSLFLGGLRSFQSLARDYDT